MKAILNININWTLVAFIAIPLLIIAVTAIAAINAPSNFI